MELEGSQGDDIRNTVPEGADRADERATSGIGAPGSPAGTGMAEGNASTEPTEAETEVGTSVRDSTEEASPMALVQRLRIAVEQRSRKLAKLRDDTAALREEIAQLREQPGALVEELNQLRGALEAALEELSPGGRTAAPIRESPMPAEPERLEPAENSRAVPPLLTEPLQEVLGSQEVAKPPEPQNWDAEAQSWDAEPDRWDVESHTWDSDTHSWDAEDSSSASDSSGQPKLDDEGDANAGEDRAARLFRLRKRH